MTVAMMSGSAMDWLPTTLSGVVRNMSATTLNDAFG